MSATYVNPMNDVILWNSPGLFIYIYFNYVGNFAEIVAIIFGMDQSDKKMKTQHSLICIGNLSGVLH